MKYNVGDVNVVVGEPPDGNPYRGVSLMGVERSEALRKFMRGLTTGKLTFWYAPCCGGAKRCTAGEVNWGSAGLSYGDWVDESSGAKCLKCGKRVWLTERRRCRCDED